MSWIAFQTAALVAGVACTLSFAQSAARAEPPAGVQIDVQADYSPADLNYIAKSDAALISIKPDDAKLLDGWKSAGALGDFFVPREKDTIVPLNIALVNKTSAPVEIKTFSVEFASSVTDLQPVLRLRAPDKSCDYAPRFSIENYGWSAPLKTEIEFAFSHNENASLADATTLDTPIEKASMAATDGFAWTFDSEPALIRLGFDAKKFKDWSDALAEAFVRDRKAALDTGLGCGKQTDDECLASLRAGALGRVSPAVTLKSGLLKTVVAGRISYRWRDAKGKERAYSTPFRKAVYLGERGGFCEYYSNQLIPPSELKAVNLIDLKLDQPPYNVVVPANGTLPAGAQGSIRIALRSAKSSQTRFRIVLETAAGKKLTSKPVEWLAFVPRTRERWKP